MVTREEVQKAKEAFGEWFPRHGVLQTNKNSLYTGLHAALKAKEVSRGELIELGEKIKATLGKMKLGEITRDDIAKIVEKAEAIHEKHGWRKAVAHLHEHLEPEHEVEDDDVIEEEPPSEPEFEYLPPREIEDIHEKLAPRVNLTLREVETAVSPVLDHTHRLGIDPNGVKWTLLALAGSAVTDKKTLGIATALLAETLQNARTVHPGALSKVAQLLHFRQRIHGRPATLNDLREILAHQFPSRKK